MDASKTYHGRIDTDPETGEGIVTFPPEVLEIMGWGEGTTVSIEVLEEGGLRITKVEA
jgi:bifunctional DNA-binding transcriptional regulator/antitoxin component of YhaV-PrlF toxin-antitoxin module